MLSEADALAQIAVSTTCTMLSALSVPAHHVDVVAIPIADPTATTTVSLAWRATGLAPHTQTFIEPVQRLADPSAASAKVI